MEKKVVIALKKVVPKKSFTEMFTLLFVDINEKKMFATDSYKLLDAKIDFDISGEWDNWTFLIDPKDIREDEITKWEIIDWKIFKISYGKMADSFHPIYQKWWNLPSGQLTHWIDIPNYTRMIKPNTVVYNSVGITKELIQWLTIWQSLWIYWYIKWDNILIHKDDKMTYILRMPEIIENNVDLNNI